MIDQDLDRELDKPNGWPANDFECRLENLLTAIENFIDKPGYKTKEVLVSLVSTYDLNQKSGLGLFRITEYEAVCINTIYSYASIIQLYTAKTYLYELLGERARLINMISKMPGMDGINDEAYQYLLPNLALYYSTYQQFNWNKKRSFVDQLIDTLNQILAHYPEEVHKHYTVAFITLVNDISYFRCKKKNSIWAFTRDELTKIFEFEANFLKKNGESAIERPLKGVLMTVISNYILKSRYDYNSDYLCKYVSKSVASSSFNNHEIWMQKTEYLNDKREGKVIPQLFSTKKWISHDWARNIIFDLRRTYYVSSFSKSASNPIMSKKYGQCIYGYKDDRIAELLSPIYTIGENKNIPQFGQVISYDILYDENLAKEEINFLCSIIDLFDLTDEQKKAFLSEIMQYWILSVKDKKWSYERERRYVLFLYDEYNYIELNQDDDRFLKLKTSLFLSPDFILGNNPIKESLRIVNWQKRMAINIKDYVFCYNCFASDFDLVYKEPEKCPICQSDNISLIKIERYKKV